MFSRWLTLPSDRSCLLVGPRRSGKTTLLKQQFPDLEYRTLDDLDFLDWAEQDPKGFVKDLGQSGIIDEIQRHPRLTLAVKHAIDTQGAFILMTGSSTLGLLDTAADTLAGRITLQSLPLPAGARSLGRPHTVSCKKRLIPCRLRRQIAACSRPWPLASFRKSLPVDPMRRRKKC